MSRAAKLPGHASPTALLVLTTCLVIACTSAPQHETPTHTLAAYSWLLGEWRADTGKNYIHESWQAEGQHSFIGNGATQSKQGGERKGFERLELVSRDGKTFYVATVAGNPAAVAFTLSGNNPDQLVFTNPEHDFPKKIVYQRVGQDQLRVVVSDGGDRGFALDFTRTNENLGNATKDN